MIAWFLCPYKLRAHKNIFGGPIRYPAIFDFKVQIEKEGGKIAHGEVLGDHAVVKVRASDKTIAQIAATDGFTRLPKTLLTAPLSDLTSAQKTAIQAKVEALGYDTTEIRNTLGTNIGEKTLGDVLKFVAKRRLRPRWNREKDTVEFTDKVEPCVAIEDIDKMVKE